MAIENLQQAHGFKVKSPKKNSLHIIFSYLVWTMDRNMVILKF